MRIAALSACLVTLCLAAAPAFAEQQCDTRESMLDALAETYGEVPVAVGEHANGGKIELLSKSDGDTWSLIVTSEEGWSCFLATGESWRELRVQQSRNPAEAE